jgi:hypothetical protein
MSLSVIPPAMVHRQQLPGNAGGALKTGAEMVVEKHLSLDILRDSTRDDTEATEVEPPLLPDRLR